MHDMEKSDGLVVPEKSPNNAVSTAAEVMEGRSPAKGNAIERNAPRTQSRTSAPSALDRVREAARRDRKARFTALLHHVTVERLRDAYLALERRAAAGVDGVTWTQYGEGLEQRLQDLHARLHRGAYRARPSRRVYIPKPDGRQRPLGVASLEDKIVQRAVVEVLNAIYEVDFLGFSYGFRPGRNPHQALDALATAIAQRKVNWVLDADIRGFFDAIDHGWMVKFLEHRIGDPRIVRLIQKWLAAGVLQDGEWSSTKEGTPQGATVSPLLANVYLHYGFDLWVQQWRKLHAEGEVIVVRYADDFVLGFQREGDARRFRHALDLRLKRFGLELHPDKTRLICFGRFARQMRGERGQGKPETFDFLGFTHVCGKSKAGKFLLIRLTSKPRMRAKLRALKVELRRRRHQPIKEQGEWLGSVVRGYFQYHAIPMNGKRLRGFRSRLLRHWFRALRGRSQRDRTTWAKVYALHDRYLPELKTLHPYPWERFDARTRGKSRVR
ncbi:group II intron reverse transcriptase/maturase [Sorangium sp. So ce542]|uniref:group II intron reverse transcriptase/maturase n=1 Tax=Sorangium sp. So ce542 TaxID=3133316 RepID=UPI003F5F2492